ncbi:MAG: type II secretion system protein [Methylococcales bacterium]|nr:type II secretion system protein [Methylococcales bacterium]
MRQYIRRQAENKQDSCQYGEAKASLSLGCQVRSNSNGFTLLELIMVIVIVGILAAMTTDIITLPVKSYIDLERRTTLVDSAEMALRRMQRDIRRALPNSIRITAGGTAIEWLHTSDGGRYRAELASDGTGNILKFISADISFDVLSPLIAVPSGKLVIYNLGTSTADAYTGNNLANIASTSTINSIVLSPAKFFPLQSPQQRFFIVDTPITYSCASGELRRYDNYSITSAAPNLASLGYDLQAKANTLACNFSYDSGTATRAGLVTLEITLTDEVGESARLIHQVHVDNMP